MRVSDDGPGRARRRGGRTPSPAVAIAALLALGAALSIPVDAARSRTYKNRTYRIAYLEVPRYWQSASFVPYPGVLVIATRGRGSRFVVGGQHVRPGTMALQLAADAGALLRRQGYGNPVVTPLAPRPGGGEQLQLDATDDSGATLMRQVYVVDGDVAIVLTMTAPAARAAQALRAFESAVRSLTVARPGSPDGAADVAPPTPAPDAGPSAPARPSSNADGGAK